MKTASSRAVKGGIGLAARSENERLVRAGPWVVSITVRRVTAGRWAIDLLVLALAAFSLAVTAVGGLAVVSAWVPTAYSVTAPGLRQGDPEVGASSFGVWDGSPGRYELQ